MTIAAQRPLLEATAQPERLNKSSACWLELRRAAGTLAASIPPQLQLDCAQAFMAETIAAYWFHLEQRPQSPLREAPHATYELGNEGLSLAVRLGKSASELSIDDAAYALGTTYAAMLPPKLRASRGVFYTPSPLVEFLLDRATDAGVDWSTARVLDPACGGGAFLSPILRRLAAPIQSAHRRVVIRNIETRLHGYEIDPFSAWMSLVFFDVTMHQELGFSDASLQPVTARDSLGEIAASAPYDLVVGNPPYGRVRLTKEERTRFARSLFGHANLYGLFLDLAISWTSSEGVIAYVAPTSFLGGEYFKRLRELLVHRAPPVELSLLCRRSGVFEDVLQETLLAIFRKGMCRNSKVQIRLLDLDHRQIKCRSQTQTDLPKTAGKPWIMARSESDMPLVQQLEDMPHRLADWGYKISTGPLVWNRHKDRLRKEPGPGHVPLIWAEAVSPNGTFQFRAERRNHAPYFAIRSEDDSVLIRKPCVLLQRTTSKEQARRLIAAELPEEFLVQHGAVAIENHLNMVIPIVEKPPVSTEVLTRFLNSELADRIFRCISGTVAVSAYELESMPLPRPCDIEDALQESMPDLFGIS